MKIVCSFLLVLFFSSSIYAQTGFPKKYYSLSTKEAKKYFIKYFIPKIENENMKILADRLFIENLVNAPKPVEGTPSYKRLQDLQKKYKIKNLFDYPKFLVRIDIIPPSLALAQAATESGWGKSRFFKEANNIFGHWTYNAKIGMLPLQREEGKKHLVRVFPNLEASIAAYMLNLNRTVAYAKFRIKRREARINGSLISGLKLCETMTKYSAIGYEYVKILRSVIRKNNLIEIDKNFHEKINNLK
ncbi:glucosaminidase domain-containing protein [Halarcobacter ebronensis]|uniref:Mannosyl-glycoprotein endo-beta-N-acetylglucosamidase n=1 Tax=Halarcobacter ebronensis TaxID=1462615 RepID=A0A4Q1AV01_9BACT|nr:glucosaminidase domain-containing protein [Halarcobacter ebronensis]QKF80742.1 putative FlgJ-related protein (Bax domain) [Halarcobacter ebronensis]RXK08535.1 mannosyl-glycoprotein endo-beta-N-acetylglucosamidase [Halarcobacter ebronensis]